MSSKRRRKAREWMQAVTAKANRDVAYAADRAGAQVRRVREELTQMIPNDDEDTFYPSGKIEQPYIQVACTRDTFEKFAYDKPVPPWAYLQDYRIFGLKAEQFALILPDGRKVVWWGWKMA